MFRHFGSRRFLFALCLCASVVHSVSAAEEPTKIDTRRGDAMIGAYFAAETAKLEGAVINDIKTKEDWLRRKDELRRQLHEMLGLDPLPERTPLNPVVTGTLDHPEFTVEKLHFQSHPRLYVTANHLGWLITIFRDDDPPDDPHAPKTRGQIVFESTCAQCHGTNRLGIGTAPALRGLRHRRADAAVTNQIRTGKYAMPAIPESQLGEADLKALVDYLMLRDRPLPPARPTERPVYSFTGYPRFFDNEGYPANKPPWGTLNCIDLNTGKLLWKVPLGEHEELTRQGVPKTGTENYGGAIVTAGGLVFCAGTRDRKLRAFDKDNGAELWSAELPWVGNAPPATYEVNGRQFIVIPATGSKLESQRGDAYVAFALPKR